VSFCSHCGANVTAGANFCAACGKSVSAAPVSWTPPPAAPTYAAQDYAPQGYAAPPAPQPAVTQGMAIAALLLNILIWPGLGSLIAGVQKGWAQGFLCLGGIILTITILGAIIGIPMIIGAWIWGIVTGVSLLQGGRG
jgi:hypothetical protein